MLILPTSSLSLSHSRVLPRCQVLEFFLYEFATTDNTRSLDVGCTACGVVPLPNNDVRTMPGA